MTKRIIYIFLGSLLLLVIILSLWYWFFGRGGVSPENLGSFATSTERTGGNGVGSGLSGNGQAPIGSDTGAGVNGSSGGNGQTPIGSNNGGSGSSNGSDYVDLVDNNVEVSPDIVWNDSSSFDNGQLALFNPTPINAVNGGDISGSPYITQAIGADGKPINLLAGLGVAIGGCILQYGLNLNATKVGTAIQSLVGTDIAKVQVAAQSTNAAVGTNAVTDCLVRTLGRAAVQAITNSTVAWINSGFNGKPAYVQDFNKFFTDVADQAAGAYLQSSDFAFLCSPFQLKVKVAVALSYARSGGAASAPSCTLSGAVGNVQAFLNGNFSQGGGWGGLIKFTTEPGNNPFAAYMSLQDRLNSAVANAKQTGTLEINLGQGFLSVKDKNGNITTPGKVIESSLETSLGASVQSLQVGDSINEILAALQNALITKILYSGLFNAGGGNSASNANNPTQTAADNLMNEMRASVSNTQQYAGVEQRIITDIQATQQNLIDELNCWLTASTSPTLSSSDKATARAKGDAVQARVYDLEAQIAIYNQNIAKANTSIAAIQQLQTNLLLATVPNDVTQVKNDWQNMQAIDLPHVYTAADAASASQDRTTVQSNLANINADSNTNLDQCNALGQ